MLKSAKEKRTELKFIQRYVCYSMCCIHHHPIAYECFSEEIGWKFRIFMTAENSKRAIMRPVQLSRFMHSHKPKVISHFHIHMETYYYCNYGVIPQLSIHSHSRTHMSLSWLFWCFENMLNWTISTGVLTLYNACLQFLQQTRKMCITIETRSHEANI